MRRTTRPRAVRRAAAATIAVLALGGLTACGGDDSPTGADDSSETAESAGESSESADTPAADESIDPATFVDDVLGSMTDVTTAHMSMSTEGGPMALTMEGDVDYTTTPPTMAMTMTDPMGGQGEVEMRLVDGAMYLKMAQIGNGKWIKMDLSGDDALLGEDLVEQMDPGASLERMKDAVTEVRFVGEEEVDGETLEHYEMTVRSDAVQDLQAELGTGADLPEVITYDIWTDADGLMRRTEMALGDLGSVTITLSNWGEPVEVEAPPASEVMRMPDGLSLAG